MNAKNIIPGDADLNIVIMAALDVGAGFATFPLVQYCGRRISTSICLLITGSSFVFSSSVSNLLIKQVFAQLGQFVNTICFNLMYVFSAEIYPTVVRSRALGLLGCSGRIGCLLGYDFAPKRIYLDAPRNQGGGNDGYLGGWREF